MPGVLKTALNVAVPLARMDAEGRAASGSVLLKNTMLL